jgi:hypothetical protein
VTVDLHVLRPTRLAEKRCQTINTEKKVMIIAFILVVLMIPILYYNINYYNIYASNEAKKIIPTLNNYKTAGGYSNVPNGTANVEGMAGFLIISNAAGSETEAEREQNYISMNSDFMSRCSNVSIPSDSCSPDFLGQFIANNYLNDFGKNYNLDKIFSINNYTFSSIPKSTLSNILNMWNEYFQNKTNFSQDDIPTFHEVIRGQILLGDLKKTPPQQVSGESLFWVLKLSRMPTNDVETKFDQIYVLLKLVGYKNQGTTIDLVDQTPGINVEEANKNICGNIPSVESLNNSPTVLSKYVDIMYLCKIPENNAIVSKIMYSFQQNYTDLEEEGMKIILMQDLNTEFYKG